MSKRTSFGLVDAALRDLDPATPSGLTSEERQRADATFARIVATPIDAPAQAAKPRARRRLTWLLVPAGLLAAAALVVPTALTGEPAFASWTATPSPLSDATARAATTACLNQLTLDDPYEVDRTPRVVIGERRGGWIYVLLAGHGEAQCLMRDELLGDTDATPRARSIVAGSYDPEPPPAPTLTPSSVVQTAIQVGAVDVDRPFPTMTAHEMVGLVSGYAGKDVTSITLHPPVGPAVDASLARGRFAAWWPAGSAHGDDAGAGRRLTYTVTLADGTSREVDPG